MRARRRLRQWRALGRGHWAVRCFRCVRGMPWEPASASDKQQCRVARERRHDCAKAVREQVCRCREGLWCAANNSPRRRDMSATHGACVRLCGGRIGRAPHVYRVSRVKGPYGPFRRTCFQDDRCVGNMFI